MKKGEKMLEEQKRKIGMANAISQLGRIPWNKSKKGLQVSWNKGKSWSLEARQKLSQACKGQITWNKGSRGLHKWSNKERENRLNNGVKRNPYFGLKGTELLEAKAGRKKPKICEVCFSFKGRGKDIHFDHDHKTGKFRGWICVNCNHVLGAVCDDVKILKALIDYLNSHER